MYKPVWWPAGVLFTDINNRTERPKRLELIAIMESYRSWNLHGQPEECVVDSQPHDPQIPIPVATSTLVTSDPRASTPEVLVLDFRTVPTNKKVFCVVYGYAGKAELIKGY